MARPRVKLSSRGARAILKSPEVQADLQRRINGGVADANAIAGIEGAEYEGDVRVGATRARGSLRTANYEARLDNARSNTILKSVDGMR